MDWIQKSIIIVVVLSLLSVVSASIFSQTTIISDNVTFQYVPDGLDQNGVWVYDFLTAVDDDNSTFDNSVECYTANSTTDYFTLTNTTSVKVRYSFNGSLVNVSLPGSCLGGNVTLVAISEDKTSCT